MPIASVPLEERLGRLLKSAYARLAELIDDSLAPLGITARQLAMLVVIDTEDAPSQISVSERLGIDRTTVVAMLDELERAGLAERRRDPGDRRRNTLALTPGGRALVPLAEKARAAAENDFLSVLGEHDTARFVESLRRVAGSG